MGGLGGDVGTLCSGRPPDNPGLVGNNSIKPSDIGDII